MSTLCVVYYDERPGLRGSRRARPLSGCELPEHQHSHGRYDKRDRDQRKDMTVPLPIGIGNPQDTRTILHAA
jgi:hypothetical protein